MSLQQIATFLETYKNRLRATEGDRDEIVCVLAQFVKFSITKDLCTLTKGVLIVRSGSAVKNELFLHKQQILDELKRIGRTDVVDIR